MNKLKAIVPLMLAAVMLAGCGSSEDSSKRPSLLDEINNSGTDGGGGGNGPGRATGYEWLIDPTIEAENIIAPDGAQVYADEVINNAYFRVAIIERDGLYGFIDYNGSVIVKPEYTDYYIDYDGQMNLMRVTNEGTEYCAVDKHGYVVYTGVDRKVNERFFYYDSGLGKTFYQNYGDDYSKEYTGSRVIAVQEAQATDKGKGKYDIEITNDKYAIIKDNELLSDFIYEDAYFSIYKSTFKTGMALEKDGKWGYFDGNGEQVIDFICDVVPHASLASSFSASEGIHPYLFADDYVAVSVNSRFGYYDRDGNVVVTPGEFEQARPVLNGMAWVRKGGKWGVIQIGEIDEKLNITTTTTTTTTKATTAKWTGTTTAASEKETEETTKEPEETEKTEKETKKTKKTEEEKTEKPQETTKPPETTTTTEQVTQPPETTPEQTEPAVTEPPEETPPQEQQGGEE